MIQNKHWIWIIPTFLLCSLFTLLLGETPFSSVWMGVKERFLGLSLEWNPLLDERLPRLFILLCTGASLAVSGAVTQSLFHNPLASPSVLGISSGGNLAAILVFIFNWHLSYHYTIPLMAVMGCFCTLCLVYLISRSQSGISIHHLILTGIAISTILTAIHSLLLYALREHWQLIQLISEWEAGSTIDRNWVHVHMQLPLTLVGLYGCWFYKRELNLLALGEEEAKILGVEVEVVRWRLFLCISLLMGGTLAAVGIIPFFGLIIPHLFRSLQGPNHDSLIPLCLIGGATVFTALDLFLRLSVIHILSIGNLSALLGGLFFLFLLFRSSKQQATS
jgi:iron complex transport system permease protein